MMSSQYQTRGGVRSIPRSRDHYQEEMQYPMPDYTSSYLDDLSMQPRTMSNYGLPTPTEMSFDFSTPLMSMGITEVPESHGSSKQHASSSGGGSKMSRNSSRSHHRHDSGSSGRRSRNMSENNDNGGDENPEYIPSSQSKGKARSSSGPDFACWFFKYDPIKYADCMHVRGRSSDLKYAHLKHHFRNGGVPHGFDKNMSWDEVWSTLFPGLPPPQNKYYVINDMIMSILESSQVKGDDVARFISAFENLKTNDKLLEQIYAFSNDQVKSTTVTTTSSSKGSRKTQLPSFNQIARKVGSGRTSSSDEYIINAHSSRGASGAGMMQQLEESYEHINAHTAGLDIAMGDSSSYGDFGNLDPALMLSSNTQDVGTVLIFDEQYDSKWYRRELPPPGLVDFGTFYLEHQCTKSGRGESILVYGYDDLAAEYEYHQPGERGGECHLTLFYQRR